ncbi:zinc finger protein 106 isoform X2 [Denticeps clupeoides]|uniref:C2H2-type domain-containing protein n=1 Tax=Denticeps clupeoides TaxID=299321 RepID=A0AAY4C5M3_9TELE|nr:zinc finger protein 106 isoform X2 [Denticeps clupeoides]
MGKERKCILCEIVYASKQEMDEHIRSMLHHRELENLKGRDCGHECLVCGVKMVGLTDYAKHISSPIHKQRVEARDQAGSNDQEEDYFDPGLVELIEKRKEMIRKEEAAAKQAQKDKERRWRDQPQWQQKGVSWDWRWRSNVPPPPKDWWGDMSSWQEVWGDCGSVKSNWQHHQNRQNRSATWHAEGPPNFQNWGPGAGGNMFGHHGEWGGRSADYGGYARQQRKKCSWSPAEESNRRGRDMSCQGSVQNGQHFDAFRDFSNKHFNPSRPDYQRHDDRKKTSHNRECSGEDRDGNKGTGPKTNNSYLKTDKNYRWTPYPPAKLTEINGASSENDSTSSGNQHEKQPQMDRKNLSKGVQSGGRSSSTNSMRTDMSGECMEKSSMSISRSRGMLPEDTICPSRYTVSQKYSESESSVPQRNVTSEDQELYISNLLKDAKERLLDKRPITAKHHKIETALYIEEDWVKGSPAHNQEKSPKNGHSSLSQPDDFAATRPASCRKETLSYSNSASLQYVQVSTSTMDRDEEDVKTQEGSVASVQDTSVQAMDEGLGSESDTQLGGSHVELSSSATMPTLSKLAFPACLKRDLNKHINSKCKSGTHEPNLNIARRIRNVSGTRKSELEKESGLRPTLRQLISASGSRRNVNWLQMYQEVNRQKQEREKGLPRFGIEMVPNEQESLTHAEEEVPLSEGYQWESSMVPLASRKRSLSESSLAPDRSATTFSLFSAPSEVSGASSTLGRDRFSEQIQASKVIIEGQRQNPEEHQQRLSQTVAEGESQTIEPMEEEISCISGPELNDTQGGGKKRRAAGDIPTPEIPNTQRTNKRRKLKIKKERSRVDELLAVSLKEEELSNSLQAVESSLTRARAALQTAYMEVQRLQVVKQQVTTKMDSLRTKRIEILQGMQDADNCNMGNNQDTPSSISITSPAPGTEIYSEQNQPSEMIREGQKQNPDNHQQRSQAVAEGEPQRLRVVEAVSMTTTAARSSPFSTLSGKPDPPTPSVPSAQVTPTQPVVIKQEPLSPFRLCPEPKQVQSTTPEPLIAPNTGLMPQNSSVEMVVDNQPNIDHDPVSKMSNCASPPNSRNRQSSPLCSRRSSRILALSQLNETSQPHEIASKLQPSLPSSPQPQTVKGVKVRKLRKKRDLRKAQGSCEAKELSDTELEGEATDARPPVRKLRSRRKPNSSPSTASTNTEEQQEADETKPVPVKEHSSPSMSTATPPSTLLSPTIKPEAEDSDSSELEMVELPQAPPSDMVTIAISDHEEEMAEENEPKPTLDCSKDSPLPAASSAPKLACNEVTSTSEMGTNTQTVVCKMDPSLPAVNAVKTGNSSDASSDAGEDSEPTEGVFQGHQEAVNGMQIHNGLLYTCSGDRTIKAFRLSNHKCVAVFEGHTSKVNCLLVSSGPGLQHRLYSGSSDQTIRCYNLKTRECVEQFSLPDRILCLHSRWKVLYAGLANGSVVTFNLKNNKQLDVFECHGPRAVSCLATAQEGARLILLVGSYDSSISVRDAKSGLLLRTLEGHTKTVLCIKVVNDLVFSGSSDQSVHAHNIHTGQLVRIYKGHSHAVTVVAILGKVMVTACLDKLVRVYELQSHDRLQVYGGHSDMVMCMAIHKSMIYTGCYDGSVQAVRLNLIQNYRCWWHGCSLIFGVMEHLQQHLLTDHANPKLQTLKCRWRNCDGFFTSRNGFKQGLQKHMLKHAEEESKMES